MLLLGLGFMGFWLMLVGGLQAHFGHWTELNDTRVWAIPSGHGNATRAIIVCSYLFVCSFAITMGPVSWTYPAEIFPMRVRAKAVSLSTASNWAFNFALVSFFPIHFHIQTLELIISFFRLGLSHQASAPSHGRSTSSSARSTSLDSFTSFSASRKRRDARSRRSKRSSPKDTSSLPGRSSQTWARRLSRRSKPRQRTPSTTRRLLLRRRRENSFIYLDASLVSFNMFTSHS